jgi:hypothetical protein
LHLYLFVIGDTTKHEIGGAHHDDATITPLPPDLRRSLVYMVINSSISLEKNLWFKIAQQHCQIAKSAETLSTKSSTHDDVNKKDELSRLQCELLKQTRKLAMEYEMLQESDHIMVCASGGKDSATLLFLLRELQTKLPIPFDITAVHVDQKQSGYNGTALIECLQESNVTFQIVEEDTYSVVVDKSTRRRNLNRNHSAHFVQDYVEEDSTQLQFPSTVTRLRWDIMETMHSKLYC